jgi:thiol:disulfide interchange protein
MKKQPRRSGASKLSDARWQMGIVIGVLVLVVVVLALKRTDPTATAASEGPGAVAYALDTGARSDPIENPLAPATDELPEAHMERLLDGGYPIFLFFHSTTCYQCIEMTKIVDQVYPGFETQVALVDVNVYDESNRPLLQRAGIRVIPTLIFVDRTGTGQGFTGVMPAEQLREMLETLGTGDTP